MNLCAVCCHELKEDWALDSSSEINDARKPVNNICGCIFHRSCLNAINQIQSAQGYSACFKCRKLNRVIPAFAQDRIESDLVRESRWIYELIIPFLLLFVFVHK